MRSRPIPLRPETEAGEQLADSSLKFRENQVAGGSTKVLFSPKHNGHWDMGIPDRAERTMSHALEHGSETGRADGMCGPTGLRRSTLRWAPRAPSLRSELF